MKKCFACKKIKESTEFYVDNRLKSGLASSCKVCVEGRVDQKKKYQRFRENNPVAYLVNPARCRAKQKQIPFDINNDDVVIPAICPVLGIPLIASKHKYSPNSPSLDRIKPALGYVKGNVRVISYRANMLKNDATIEELQKVIDYMQNNG